MKPKLRAFNLQLQYSQMSMCFAGCSRKSSQFAQIITSSEALFVSLPVNVNCQLEPKSWEFDKYTWLPTFEHICNTSTLFIFTVHIFLGQAAVVFGSHAETKSVVSVAVRLEARGRCSWCMFGFTRFVGHLNLRFWTGNLTFFRLNSGILPGFGSSHLVFQAIYINLVCWILGSNG